MILRNAQGEESIRKFNSKTLEVDGDGDKSIFIFEHPRDVEGTAVLTFTHKVGPDDQWLYLPALKRVKRISSDNKSGSFVGSEFAYEDLSSQEIEKYTYKWVEDVVCPGFERKLAMLQKIIQLINHRVIQEELYGWIKANIEYGKLIFMIVKMIY